VTAMKVRIYSWFLASLYLLCGATFFVVVAKFQAFFSELEVPLPLLTRAVFFVSPLGWLALAVVVALAVVLKDLRFRSRFLNPLFTIILLVAVGGIAVALFVAILECPTERLGEGRREAGRRLDCPVREA
jgi:hypothetical protein